MYKCYIITSYMEGNASPLDEITEEDMVICADNGCNIAKNHHIMPDVLIGDFDSLLGDFPAGTEVISLPVEKDDTDTLACIKHAIEKGYKEILVMGGIGGRLDHTMANLQSLRYGLDYGVFIELRDEKNIATMHLPGELIIERRPGFQISLFSFSDSCSGVCTKGLKYPLDHYTLTQGFPLGISNEFTGELAKISFQSGILLVILSKD